VYGILSILEGGDCSDSCKVKLWFELDDWAKHVKGRSVHVNRVSPANMNAPPPPDVLDETKFGAFLLVNDALKSAEVLVRTKLGRHAAVD
jgi:hypothetical protein